MAKLRSAHQVLWWVPRGHTPSVEEAKDKVEHIVRLDPMPEALR